METFQLTHKDGRVFLIVASNIEAAKDIFYIVCNMRY